jgi:hypothetical protein
MRALTALLATLWLVNASAPAQAADLQTCRSELTSSDAPDFKRVGRAVRKAIVPDAKRYLGAQFTAQWLQPDDAGWYVGVAPGRRSLGQTRAWLAKRVQRHFNGRDASLIRSRMHVIRQPYGMAELRETGSAVWELLSQHGPFVTWTGDEACTLSSAYRTEVTLYSDSTLKDLRDVRDALAEFGDRVRVTRVNQELDDSVD